MIKSPYSLKGQFISLILTFLLLLLAEIITSTLFPLFFPSTFRPDIGILIVFFLCFRLNFTFIPFILFFMRYLHSLFSLEHWALGTCIAIFFHFLFQYLKDILHFSSFVLVGLFNGIFLLFWYTLFALAYYIKYEALAPFLQTPFVFFLQVLFLSFLSPYAFQYLTKIWNLNEKDSLD